MDKTFRLQSLLDLSNMRLDEATRLLGKLIAGEQEASQRLVLLTQYRDEYQTRFIAAEMNHQAAIDKALKKGQGAPTDFRGALAAAL